MTAERLTFILQACFRRRRKVSLTAHHQDVARFLGVSSRTFRRWLHGEQPVPRQVEIILELFHHYPTITATGIDLLIRARDAGDDGQSIT